jgi:ferric-dicitrate binding protein FerR (iron transport regulator)
VPPPIPPPVVATVVRAIGPVRVAPRGSLSHAIATGDTLTAGVVVETMAGGRVSFQLPGGTFVRIDSGSRAVVETASRIGLERGRVYIDRTGDARTSVVEVSTQWGVVRDIGTQFEVAAAGPGVEVRVREGQVQIDGPHVSESLRRGESLRIEGPGRLIRATVATHGQEWSWTESLASPFTIEGASLERFLNWAARERGLTWQFRDAATRREAAAVVLHGSIDGLTPSEALDAVLSTCGMTYRVLDDRLVVTLASGTRR